MDNPIKYSDFIQPDDSIQVLIELLEEARTMYAKLSQTLKGQAADLENNSKKITNVTSEEQEITRKTVLEAEKLAKAYEDLKKTQSENAKEIIRLKREQSIANNVNKLTVALNNSAEGSYNRLSAQYALNKVRLNAMSQSEREATEEGRSLVEQSRALYEQMKVLQAQTGQTSLNVGNYEAATVSLREEIKKNTFELAQMKLRGEEGTAAYQSLLERTGELRDTLNDTRNEIQNMASDTSSLDSVLSAASAGAGGFSVFTGAMELFGSGSKEVEEAQKSLQATIAITTGLQSVQNAVQRDSAMMMGISRIQTYALAKSEAYRRLIQIQGTNATIGATIAQKTFNLVASANPYVLLATAILTIVGALVIFSKGTETAAEKQNRLNAYQKEHINILEQESKALSEFSTQRIKNIEKELDVAKARGARSEELRVIEDRLAEARRKNHAESVGFYSQEIKDLDINKIKLQDLQRELSRLNEAKAEGQKKVFVDLELNGNITKEKIDEALDVIQGKIDNFGRLVEIGTRLKEQEEDLNKQEAVREAERAKARKDRAKELYEGEREILRKAEDAKFSLIQNTRQREITETKASYSRQIQDLQYQLKTDLNLTKKGREAINQLIVTLSTKRDEDLRVLENKYSEEKMNQQRIAQDLFIEVMGEGIEKERTILLSDYDRRIEDLRFRLETEKGLTLEQRKELYDNIVQIEVAKFTALDKLEADHRMKLSAASIEATQIQLEGVKEGSQEEFDLRIQLLQKQRTLELQENASKTNELRQSEKEINKKYDRLILKQIDDFNRDKGLLQLSQQQDLAASEFDLLRTTEEQKTQFRLNQEKERLKKILELNQSASNKLTDIQVATIQNSIAKIDQEIAKSKGKDLDIYSLTGLNLDEDQKSAISDSTSFAIGQLSNYLQAQIEAAQIAVDLANKEVDSKQTALEAEIEARNNGYASNVALANKELDMARRNQDKALKEQEKARKAQLLLDTIMQTSSLVTASAKIWGQLGFPWAIPALGIMWGSFAFAKIKAAQVTKQQYGEGGLEFLQGGSHASGNDIPLGMTSDGKDRRAEGGEALAIFRKSSTRKYKDILPRIVKSLNAGVFEEQFMNSHFGGPVVNIPGTDLSGLEDKVDSIRKQGEKKYFIDSKGRMIEQYKNLTTIYHVN